MDQNCQLHEQDRQLHEQGKNIDAQKKCIIDLKAQNAYLQEQLRLANLRRFARSSERFVDPNDPQGLLFDEDELPIPEEKDVEIQDIPAHQRKKRRGKRESLPEFLERIRVEHTLPESELIGPDGEQYTKIGEVTSEELQVIPMQMRVIVHARYQYAVKEEELGVKIAPMPKEPKHSLFFIACPYCSSKVLSSFTALSPRTDLASLRYLYTKKQHVSMGTKTR